MASLQDADKPRGPDIYKQFSDLLRSRPLYDYTLATRDEIVGLLTVIEATGLSFDSHCPECKSNTTWRVTAEAGVPPNFHMRFQVGAVTDKQFATVLDDVFSRLDFQCARRPGHYAHFNFTVEPTGNGEDGLRLRKIGQWPSLADIAASEIDDYHSLIDAEDIAELKRAVGLAAHGIGIGSFVYIRRIFERLVNQAANRAATADNTFDKAKFATLRMEDKLQAVGAHIPEWMVRNRKLYSILSLGLHELSEETCKQAFPAVKEAILALLEQHAEQARRDSRAKQAEKALGELEQSLSVRRKS